MKKLFDFIEKIPSKYHVIIVITASIGAVIIGVLSVLFFSSLNMVAIGYIICILLAFIASFIDTVIIMNDYKISLSESFKESEDDSFKRIKMRLTKEFQTLSLKPNDNYFIKILLEEAPFVFKAKMENDIIYYKFETIDGKVFHTGETTKYSWFEKNIL